MSDCENCAGRKAALVELVKERNTWARQLADAYDEVDAARASAENLRAAVASRENIILKVEALLYEWERDGKGDGLHGRQLRLALRGERP